MHFTKKKLSEVGNLFSRDYLKLFGNGLVIFGMDSFLGIVARFISRLNCQSFQGNLFHNIKIKWEWKWIKDVMNTKWKQSWFYPMVAFAGTFYQTRIQKKCMCCCTDLGYCSIFTGLQNVRS